MARKQDVISRALQRIGVVATDETLDPHDYAAAEAVLTGLYEELAASQGVVWGFTLDGIPNTMVLPLSSLLATMIAPDYSRPQPEPYTTALMRVRAATRPVYWRNLDINGDGLVTQDEIDAIDHSQYF